MSIAKSGTGWLSKNSEAEKTVKEKLTCISTYSIGNDFFQLDRGKERELNKARKF
jgi:hypothetical protein